MLLIKHTVVISIFIHAAVDCGNLTNPVNGHVMLTDTTFPSSAIYQCNQGFILHGVAQRNCEANGRWSNRASVCRSKKLQLEKLFCSWYHGIQEQSGIAIVFSARMFDKHFSERAERVSWLLTHLKMLKYIYIISRTSSQNALRHTYVSIWPLTPTYAHARN